MDLIKNKEILIQMGIVALFGTIGYFSMLCSPIGGDEPFSIFHAQKSIPDVIAALKGGNNPPLFEIILHYWINIFGISPSSVRFPSLIFSVLLLVVVYRMVRLEHSNVLAISAVVLIGFSNYYIYFLHEARAYALLTLLVTLGAYLICLAIRNPYKISNYFLLTITYAMLAYTHYFGLFSIVLQVGFVLVFLLNHKAFVKKYLFVIIGFVILFSPYLPEVWQRFSDSSSNGTWLKPVENLGNFHDILFWFCNKSKVVYVLVLLIIYSSISKYLWSKFSTSTVVVRYGLLSVVVLFFLVSISAFVPMPFIWRLTEFKPFMYLFLGVCTGAFVYHSFTVKKRDGVQFLSLLLFLVPLLLFFIVSFKVPIFLDRYLTHIFPFFYITLVLAVSYLAQGWRSYLTLGCVLVIMIWTYRPNTSYHSRFDKVTEYIQSQKTDAAQVFICPPYTSLNYIYHSNLPTFQNSESFDSAAISQGVLPVYNSEEVSEYLGAKQVIYIDANADFVYPENGILELLNQGYTQVSHRDFDYLLHVYIFVKKE